MRKPPQEMPSKPLETRHPRITGQKVPHESSGELPEQILAASRRVVMASVGSLLIGKLHPNEPIFLTGKACESENLAKIGGLGEKAKLFMLECPMTTSGNTGASSHRVRQSPEVAGCVGFVKGCRPGRSKQPTNVVSTPVRRHDIFPGRDLR